MSRYSQLITLIRRCNIIVYSGQMLCIGNPAWVMVTVHASMTMYDYECSERNAAGLFRHASDSVRQCTEYMLGGHSSVT